MAARCTYIPNATLMKRCGSRDTVGSTASATREIDGTDSLIYVLWNSVSDLGIIRCGTCG